MTAKKSLKARTTCDTCKNHHHHPAAMRCFKLDGAVIQLLARLENVDPFELSDPVKIGRELRELGNRFLNAATQKEAA